MRCKQILKPYKLPKGDFLLCCFMDSLQSTNKMRNEVTEPENHRISLVGKDV